MDAFSIIDTLPDAVWIFDQEAETVEVNNVFLEKWGFAKDELLGVPLLEVSVFSEEIRNGLERLFAKTLYGEEQSGTFRFQFLLPGAKAKNFQTTAGRFVAEGLQYVAFTFKEVPAQESPEKDDEMESWKSYLNLAYEPYMEFQPTVSLVAPLDLENRMSFLKLAGGALRIKHANAAAAKLYCAENDSLKGKTFMSFFNNGEDALRFLDMLSIVGQMKAETAISVLNGQVLQVEMNCTVKFHKDGSIAAVYCSQRDLSGHRRYEAIIGGSRGEMEFIFNQPFIGLAFLTPTRPIERPEAQNVDRQLDEILNQILVMRANQAMIDIHSTNKAKFMMQPMMELFPDASLARQVLKELFVMRSSSATIYDAPGKMLERISIFRATFDDADRLNGVLVATSRHDNGYKARHNNKQNSD